MNVTKITKLTSHNVAALAGYADRLQVELGKTTATFTGTPADVLAQVEELREQVKAEKGGRSTEATSLVAVIGKLRKAEEVAPGKKAAPAKKASAGSRGIPAEAANKARQAYVAEVGVETYRKQYNGGWDSATYGQGEKKAKSGEASPAWMDGYTDRIANPGKEGIPAKWSALRATSAPVKKV